MIPPFILFAGIGLTVFGFIASILLDYYIGRTLTGIVSLECGRQVTFGRTFIYNLFKILIAYSIGYIVGGLKANPLTSLIIPIDTVQALLTIIGLITILLIIHHLFQFKNPVCTGTYLISDFIAEGIIIATIFLIGLAIGLSTEQLFQNI